MIHGLHDKSTLECSRIITTVILAHCLLRDMVLSGTPITLVAQCIANLQVMGSNPGITCICEGRHIRFGQGHAPLDLLAMVIFKVEV